jgi:hypothetical protein
MKISLKELKTIIKNIIRESSTKGTSDNAPPSSLINDKETAIRLLNQINGDNESGYSSLLFFKDKADQRDDQPFKKIPIFLHLLPYTIPNFNFDFDIRASRLTNTLKTLFDVTNNLAKEPYQPAIVFLASEQGKRLKELYDLLKRNISKYSEPISG